MNGLQIERAGGITLAEVDRRGVLARAPAWWRELAQRGGNATANPMRDTTPHARPAVIGWLSGVCCPGVSKPCHGHVDGLTLPEQFTPRAWDAMLAQVRSCKVEVPLRHGHHGPVLATTRGLDLVFTMHPVYGLEFEARLRDTAACRAVLDAIGPTGWGVSIGFTRGKQWTVHRDGVGRVRVIDDAVLDHIAVVDGTANRSAAYPAARCHAMRTTATLCPRALKASTHGWAVRILAMQAGAKR